MKRRFMRLAVLAMVIPLTTVSFGQTLSEQLDGNNINATILNSGVFFKTDPSGAGYEYPKGEGNHLIYSQAFWFGAIDGSGALKMAADMYGMEGERDFFPGALKADGSAEALDPAYADQIYKVSRAEIEYHVLHYPDMDYDMPFGISHWPAHGDVALGMDFQLAPFADLNGNGVYEPEEGEYPEIRGDHAVYLIMNDRAGLHLSSGGDQLGIEIHYMFYQYDETGDIGNTTFINARVINRSSNNYPEFIVGNFMDFDIGFSEDDYVGCDSTNNLMYGYAGDLLDEGTGGGPGYGENPPATGIVSLNNPMHVSGNFDRSIPPYNDPNSAADFWNYMNGRWKTGAPFTFGGTGHDGGGVTTRYIYSSDPTADFDGAWSEITEGNPAGDRRAFMASEPVPFNAGEVRCYDYAVITEHTSGILENASQLIDQAAEVKAFYDEQPNIYCDFTLDLPETTEESAFSVYPNPSNGRFTVEKEGRFDLMVFAMDGRLVLSQSAQVDMAEIQTKLATGTYVLTVTGIDEEPQTSLITIK